MKTHHKFLITSALLATLLASHAFAVENIRRPFYSVRSGGMGGVRITTGLYDENFFGNPARVTANPKWRFQILDITSEGNATVANTVNKIAGAKGDDVLSEISDTAGKNNHGRVQTVFPALYLPNTAFKLAVAVGLITNTQFDFALRRSFQLEPVIYTDVGPAVTIGRKFGAMERLSVGLTTHMTYRLATRSGYSLVDLIRGASISPKESGGEGAHLDFDLGTTYQLPWQPWNLEITTAATVNNLLGGKYNTIKLELAKNGMLPPAQPRSFGFGVAAKKSSLWKLSDTTLALELTDIGNNPDGSFFRLVHLGMETHWSILAPRVGINQGYLCAGLGLDLKILTIEFATYGEELAKNVGFMEDRRYALKLALQI